MPGVFNLSVDEAVPEAAEAHSLGVPAVILFGLPEKKDELAQLEAALKTAKPIQFKENIALVLKHYDKLLPLMQEPGRS